MIFTCGRAGKGGAATDFTNENGHGTKWFLFLLNITLGIKEIEI